MEKHHRRNTTRRTTRRDNNNNLSGLSNREHDNHTHNHMASTHSMHPRTQLSAVSAANGEGDLNFATASSASARGNAAGRCTRRRGA